MKYSINIQNLISGEIFTFKTLIDAEKFIEIIMQKQTPIAVSYGNRLC